jgi:hypothetical protein
MISGARSVGGNRPGIYGDPVDQRSPRTAENRPLRYRLYAELTNSQALQFQPSTAASGSPAIRALIQASTRSLLR